MFGRQKNQPALAPRGVDPNVKGGRLGLGFDSPVLAEGIRQNIFDEETARLARQGGGVFSKVAKTATSVRSAQSSTVAQRRRRGVFVIPRERRRGLTAQGLGVNVASGPGLNIVI